MKRIVALLVLVAMSAMLFACGSPAVSTTAYGTESSSSSAGLPNVPVGSYITPYADIDFSDGEIKDKKESITLEIKNGGDDKAAYITELPVSFMGKEKTLPVLCIKKAGAWVKGTFSAFENGEEFDAFVAESGGFSVEAFYLDNSTTGANRGIVCSTESIGGDARRSGWGIAESANGAPYFITGHTAENAYSVVYASEASKTEFVHVIGVYNAETKRNSIYVNGSLASSDTAAGSFTSADKTDVYENFNMANAFYIGADPCAAGGKAEKCDFPANDLMVLDIKFYACALTDEEARTVYAISAKAFS